MKLLLTLACLLSGISLFAQDSLRMAVNENPPYVVYRKTGNTVTGCTGISIDVAENLFGHAISYVYCKSKNEVLETVKKGDADVGASVTLTSDRMKDFTFSRGYITIQIGALVKKSEQPTLLQSFLVGISNEKFLISLLQSILVILGLAFLTGLILYIMEHKPMRKGLFAAVYVCYVGIAFLAGLEGEPVRKRSKIVLTGIILLYSLSFGPYIIGYIVTQIQQQHAQTSDYRTTDQLKHLSLYTSGHTSNEFTLSHLGLSYQTGPLDSVLPAICEGDAVYVHDKNVLAVYIHEHNLQDKVEVAPVSIAETYKCFIYSKKYKSKNHHYDQLIVKMRENGQLAEIINHHIPMSP